MRRIITVVLMISVLFSAWSINALAAESTAETFYLEGMTFFEEEDFAKAFPYFQIAGAERNYAPAQNMLGVCYLKGLGVTRNVNEAEKYFRLAADQGNPDAAANLAELEAKKEELLSEPMTLLIGGTDEEATKIFEGISDTGLAEEPEPEREEEKELKEEAQIEISEKRIVVYADAGGGGGDASGGYSSSGRSGRGGGYSSGPSVFVAGF